MDEIVKTKYEKLLDALFTLGDLSVVRATVQSMLAQKNKDLQDLCAHWGYVYVAQLESAPLMDVLEQCCLPYPVYQKEHQIQGDPVVNLAYLGHSAPLYARLVQKMRTANTPSRSLAIERLAFEDACKRGNHAIALSALEHNEKLVNEKNATLWAQYLKKEQYGRGSKLLPNSSNSSKKNMLDVEKKARDLKRKVAALFGNFLEKGTIDVLQMENIENVTGFMHPKARFAAYAPLWMWAQYDPSVQKIEQGLQKREKIDAVQQSLMRTLQRPALLHYWHDQFEKDTDVLIEPSTDLVAAMQSVVKTMPYSLVQDAIMMGIGGQTLQNIECILKHNLECYFEHSHPLLTHFLLTRGNLDQKLYDTRALCDLWEHYRMHALSESCSNALALSIMNVYQVHEHWHPNIAEHWKSLERFCAPKSGALIDSFLARSKNKVKGSQNVELTEEQKSLMEAARLHVQCDLLKAQKTQAISIQEYQEQNMDGVRLSALRL